MAYDINDLVLALPKANRALTDIRNLPEDEQEEMSFREDIEREKLSVLLNDLMTWEQTPQGHAFWCKQYYYLSDKENKERETST